MYMVRAHSWTILSLVLDGIPMEIAFMHVSGPPERGRGDYTVNLIKRTYMHALVGG